LEIDFDSLIQGFHVSLKLFFCSFLWVVLIQKTFNFGVKSVKAKIGFIQN